MSSLSPRLWIENRQRVIVGAVVSVLVLTASGYLAPRASLTQTVTATALLGVPILLVSVLRWPSVGPLGLIVVSMIVPFQIGTGTDSPINAAILGVVATFGLWLLDLVWRSDARPAPSRLYLPLLALPSVATLAFAFGYQPQIPFAATAPLRAQLGGLAIFWLSSMAFLVVGHQVRNTRWLQGISWSFIVVGGVYIVARLAHVGIVSDKIFQKGVATGSLFYVWLVALAFSQAAFNRRLRLPFRLLCAALVVATLYLGFFQVRDWNSGWVPPLVAIGVSVLMARPRVGVPLTVLSISALVLDRTTVLGLLLNSYKQYDVLTREAAWTTLIPLIQINPVLGLGPANYYWYTPLFSILGWNVRFNSHEQYMDLILQTGFLGLLCFVWLMAEIWGLAVSLRARVPQGFEQAYVYGALGGLAATLVAGLLGDWFLPFVYNIGFVGFRASVLGWIFLGGLLVFDRSYRIAGEPSVGVFGEYVPAIR